MKNIIIILLLVFVSCSSKKHISYISENPYYWEGTYINIANWKNGQIVETRLTLKVDSTFELYMEYRGTSEPNIYRKSGEFRFDDENIVNLCGLVSRDRLYETFYIIKSDSIITNPNGQQKLKKLFSHQLTNDNWYLYTVLGTLVSPIRSQRLKSAFIKFENEGTVSGQTRCNNFNGRFDVEDDGFVTISDLNMTKMACPESELEKEYLEVLSQKFRYEIESDTLYFRDMDDNVLAKFVRQ